MAQDRHNTLSLQREREHRMHISHLSDGCTLLAAGQPIPLERLSNPVRLEKKIESDEEIASRDPNRRSIHTIAENKEVLEYIHKALGFEKFPKTEMGKIKLEITWKYAVLTRENDLKKKSSLCRHWRSEYKHDINLKDRTDLTTEEKEEVYGLLEQLKLSTFTGDVKTFCNHNVEAIRARGREAMVNVSNSDPYKLLSVVEALEIRRRNKEIPTRNFPNPVHLMHDIGSKELHRQKAEHDEMKDLLEYILDKISFVSKSRINKDDKVELELIWMTARQSDTYNNLCERLESSEGEERVKKDAITSYAKYQKKKSEFVLKHGLKNDAAVQGLLDQMARDQNSLSELAHGKRIPTSLSPTTTTTLKHTTRPAQPTAAAASSSSSSSSIPHKRTHGNGDPKGERQEEQGQRQGYDLGMKKDDIGRLIDFNKRNKPR